MDSYYTMRTVYYMPCTPCSFGGPIPPTNAFSDYFPPSLDSPMCSLDSDLFASQVIRHIDMENRGG
jgi:hypothetical protein